MKSFFGILILLLWGFLKGFSQSGSVSKDTTACLEVFGNAIVQNIHNDPTKEIPATTGIGVFYTRQQFKTTWLARYQLEGFINVASTLDTLTANYSYESNMAGENRRVFGNSILQPTLARKSASIALVMHINSQKKKNKDCEDDKTENEPPFLGIFIPNVIFGDFSAGARSWNIASDSAKYQSTIEVVPAAARLGFGYEFIPFSKCNPQNLDRYSIIFGVARSFRGIFGDASGYKNSLAKFIGTETQNYWGWDIMLRIRVQRIKFDFVLPATTSKNGHVIGLTGGQFISAVSFVGGVKIPINQK